MSHAYVTFTSKLFTIHFFAATFVMNSKWRVVKSERVVLNTKLPLISAVTEPSSDHEHVRKAAARADDEADLSKRQRRRLRGRIKGVPTEVCMELLEYRYLG